MTDTTSDHGTKAESANIDLERLAELMASTTAARGVDVYAVKGCGLSAAAWADMTDRDRSTVSRNVRRALSGMSDDNPTESVTDQNIYVVSP